jgi:hypothetical protein
MRSVVDRSIVIRRMTFNSEYRTGIGSDMPSYSIESIGITKNYQLPCRYEAATEPRAEVIMKFTAYCHLVMVLVVRRLPLHYLPSSARRVCVADFRGESTIEWYKD